MRRRRVTAIAVMRGAALIRPARTTVIACRKARRLLFTGPRLVLDVSPSPARTPHLRVLPSFAASSFVRRRRLPLRRCRWSSAAEATRRASASRERNGARDGDRIVPVRGRSRNENRPRDGKTPMLSRPLDEKLLAIGPAEIYSRGSARRRRRSNTGRRRYAPVGL